MLTAEGGSLLTCVWAAALAVGLPVQGWPDRLVTPLGLSCQYKIWMHVIAIQQIMAEKVMG